MPLVTVRYYAGARAAAGVTEEKVDAADLPDLRTALGDRHGEPLTRVLAASSLLVDGVAVSDDAAGLPVDATVEVLPPFAGG